MRSPSRKFSIYIKDEIVEQIRAESRRQDRSLSWLVSKAWKVAFPEIVKLPSFNNGGENGSAQ